MVNDATVARAKAGDADAFQAIVASYEPRIYRFLYGLVRDPELAQDLTQETFLSAYSAIGRTDNLKLTAWLYTIAKNHAYSTLRRRRLISWLPLLKTGDDGEGEDEPRSREPLEMADQVAMREDMHAALATLSAESRTILLLVAEGFTYAEIGQMMHLTMAAVRQRVFRARERLRELHEEWEA